AHPPRHAEAALERNERLRMRGTQPVEMRACLPTEVEKVLEARVRDEGGARALPLEQGVRRDGRSVREPLHVARPDRLRDGEHGHDLPLDSWATLVGTIEGPFDPMGHLEELVGAPLNREALTSRRREREFALIDLETLRPGVEEYLEEAERRGLLTAVVSSST